MARKKTPLARVDVKARISERLRALRREIFGDHGGPELARRLNLPARTWYNYESGVTVPAEVLLAFIDQTRADPTWLLSGEGEKFRHDEGPSEAILSEDLTPQQLIRRSLEILTGGRDGRVAGPDGGGDLVDFLSLDVLPIAALCPEPSASASDVPIGQVSVDRRWVPHPERTIAARLIDDAMRPILPIDSVVAIDRSPAAPASLSGRIVAACVGGRPLVRWLELSGRHLILRPGSPAREFPVVPIEPGPSAHSAVIGPVVWSWSRFAPD